MKYELAKVITVGRYVTACKINLVVVLVSFVVHLVGQYLLGECQEIHTHTLIINYIFKLWKSMLAKYVSDSPYMECD